MKKIKRILASFLAFVLMLTLLPAAALADDTESAAAPAPVISSDLSDKTYYSDDTKVSALTVRLTKKYGELYEGYAGLRVAEFR